MGSDVGLCHGWRAFSELSLVSIGKRIQCYQGKNCVSLAVLKTFRPLKYVYLSNPTLLYTTLLYTTFCIVE